MQSKLAHKALQKSIHKVVSAVKMRQNKPYKVKAHQKMLQIQPKTTLQKTKMPKTRAPQARKMG